MREAYFAAYLPLAWELMSGDAIHSGWDRHSPDAWALARELTTPPFE
jgi:hypothetical protein